MSLIDKIKALQGEIQKEFPRGGVYIYVAGVEAVEAATTKPSEYVNKIEEKPAVLEVNTETTTLDDIKKLLNGYAAKHGVETAFGLVEKLTGGSKSPADIPKEKYAYVVQACMVEGAKA